MIFHQFFDPESSTYSYLLGSRQGGEAIIIDSVESRLDDYLKVLGQHRLRLVKVFDTHTHADHITGMARLRDITHCITVMGHHTGMAKVAMRVEDGDLIELEDISLRVIHTPGHTDDSYCLYGHGMLFSGDTLLIRGTGRTDFQQGDARQQYHSIFHKLLALPDSTVLCPGHDYKGENLSTLGEERRRNPRLQVSNAEEYAALMQSLKLDLPRQMDVAIPANLAVGADIDARMADEIVVDAGQAIAWLGRDDTTFVDLREQAERERHGWLANSLHLPFKQFEPGLQDESSPLLTLLNRSDHTLVLYCAYGERSALAAQLLAAHPHRNRIKHLQGGIAAWQAAGGPLQHSP